MVFLFRRTLSPEGVLHRGFFDSFLLASKCRYYGGTELLEAVNALRLPTISMGSTEELGIRSHKITGERRALIAVPDWFQRAGHRKRGAPVGRNPSQVPARDSPIH